MKEISKAIFGRIENINRRFAHKDFSRASRDAVQGREACDPHGRENISAGDGAERHGDREVGSRHSRVRERYRKAREDFAGKDGVIKCTLHAPEGFEGIGVAQRLY